MREAPILSSSSCNFFDGVEVRAQLGPLLLDLLLVGLVVVAPPCFRRRCFAVVVAVFVFHVLSYVVVVIMVVGVASLLLLLHLLLEGCLLQLVLADAELPCQVHHALHRDGDGA